MSITLIFYHSYYPYVQNWTSFGVYLHDRKNDEIEGHFFVLGAAILIIGPFFIWYYGPDTK